MALSVGIMALGADHAGAATYMFADEARSDIVTHAPTYSGAGGNIDISVGIDPTSAFAALMSISVQNVVNTWNGLQATTNNLQNGLIPASAFDFESVLLHEMGHSLGLGHTNLASESGLSGNDRNYTESTKGSNGAFDLNPGADGVIGSSDDIRGDDVNLNLFRIADNDPFATDLGVIDSTTYSRDLSLLPVGHTFSTNADRAVSNLLGYGNTEAVMQQGTFVGETQRSLAADDVVGIRYAQSGLDELAGTADDYTFTLNFIGAQLGADIMIDFDNAKTGFALSQSGGGFLTSNHTAINTSSIFFNNTQNWHFNDTSNERAVSPVPLPGSVWALLAGFAGLGGMSTRKGRSKQAA